MSRKRKIEETETVETVEKVEEAKKVEEAEKTEKVEIKKPQPKVNPNQKEIDRIKKLIEISNDPYQISIAKETIRKLENN